MSIEHELETCDVPEYYDNDTAFAESEDRRIIETHKCSDECKSKDNYTGKCPANVAQDRIDEREREQKLLNAHEHSAWCNVSDCCVADCIWEDRENQLTRLLENGTYKEENWPEEK